MNNKSQEGQNQQHINVLAYNRHSPTKHLVKGYAQDKQVSHPS